MCWLTCVHTCKWCWKFSWNKNSPKFCTCAWGSIILEAQDLEDYERACCIWGYHGYKVLASSQDLCLWYSLLHCLVCKVDHLRWQTCWQQSFWIWNTTLGLELALNWHCEWGLVNQIKSRVLFSYRKFTLWKILVSLVFVAGWTNENILTPKFS